MLDRVKETLTQFNMIARGDLVVAGVSGGADSVALLLNLCEYSKILEFELKVVHVNHLIREDAAEDAEFVRNLCEQHGIDYHLFEIDVEKMAEDMHLTTEEAGRSARYNAMRSLKPDKIAVGHHRDDQAETVLLNMCRGTGLHGMKGISPVQNEIIRPLLFVSREEIEQYLEELCQPYQTDSTNLTTDYVRNRLRHKVIPYLNDEINEKAVTHIAEMASDMWELEKYIEESVESLFSRLCKLDIKRGEVCISIEELMKQSPYIRRELMLRVLEELTPKRKDITRTHVNIILGLCESNGEKRADLPYELQAVKSYGNLIIRKRKKEEQKELSIEITREMLTEKTEVYTDKGMLIRFRVFENDGSMTIDDNKYTKWLDYDKINCSLVVRNRLEGDYLTINDMGQKKSLKDYMINEKIPHEDRDEVVLLADGNHIMWVIGHRISAEYKISENTKNILEVCVVQAE